MKSLSFWAADHKTAARCFVALFWLLISLLGAVWALLLHAHHARLPPWFPVLPCALTIAALEYHLRHEKLLFWARRLRNLGFGLATLLFVAYGTAEAIDPAAPARGHSSTLTQAASLPDHTASAPAKERRSGLAGTVQRLVRWYHDRDNASKAGLIVLAVLLTVAALFGWAFFCACLICSGVPEAIAYLLFFGGAAVGIFVCVRIIQSLARGQPRHRRERRAAGAPRIFQFRKRSAAP